MLLPFVRPYVQMQHDPQVVRPRSEVEMSSLTLDAYRVAIAHLGPMLS